MRSGRPRSDGLGRIMEVEQESGEAMTFTLLASNALDAGVLLAALIFDEDAARAPRSDH
jgi:hypothetical protein